MTKQPPSRNHMILNCFTYGFALLPAAIIYIFRSWLAHLELELVCILAPFLIGTALTIIVMVLFSKDLGVIAACLLAFAFSGIAPRIDPNQIHLAFHRTDYQAIIGLAREHQLGHEGHCQYAYVLPKKYSYMNIHSSKCIFIEYEPALVVVFEPLFSRELLVYAESPQAVEQYISCGGSDGVGYHPIEKNWYVCYQDWN